MFTVRCPAGMVWHPMVHHSLLLLRALQQPHTLILDNQRAPTRTGLPLKFLSEHTGDFCIEPPASFFTSTTSSPSSPSAWVAPALTRVHRPEHLLFLFSAPTPPSTTIPPALSAAVAKVQRDLADYLETAVVTEHIHHALDHLVLARHAGEMEAVRQSHRTLMERLERLEGALRDNTAEGAEGTVTTTHSSNGSEAPEEPLSTWPLYATLHFLVEEAGLLSGAFPRLHAAVTTLKQQKPQQRLALKHHHALVGETLRAHGGVTLAEVPYPHQHVLRAVQRELAAYTSSVHERVTKGAVGDKGALASRTSGGRLGLQSVEARLPWTMQGTPLKRRQW